MTYKQDLQAQEDELNRILSRVYRDIKKDMNVELASGVVTWAEIQRLYRSKANDAIRSAVTEMYSLAAKKTTEKDIKIPYFLTNVDMLEIKRLTQQYTDWLWVGMEREIVKKTATAFDPLTLKRIEEGIQE